jgi:hypothetical protein
MTAPLYEASVPVFLHTLDVLADLLRKGEAHARDQGFDPQMLMAARLAPDMLTLAGQVQRASDHAKGASARLAGVEPPLFVDDERSVAEAQARIARTLAFIAALPVEAFDIAGSRVVSSPFAEPRQMPAPRYLYGFALPSFFFHVSIAYAILRHRGVPLGKRDFIGGLVSD